MELVDIEWLSCFYTLQPVLVFCFNTTCLTGPQANKHCIALFVKLDSLSVLRNLLFGKRGSDAGTLGIEVL